MRQESPEFIEAHGRLALVSGTQHGAAARQGGSRRQGNATHEAAARRLEYLHGDSAAVRLVAHRKLSQNIGWGVRIEQRLHDSAARFDETADPVGEIVGQGVSVKRLIHHGEHPFLQF